MKLLKYILIVSIAAGLSFGCQQAGLSDYSSPEGTYKTYLEQAKTLRVVADHRYYRRAIRCFMEENRKWFEQNYDSIFCNKEPGVYNNLYKTKKYAYVFGRSVVPAGPSPENKDYSVNREAEDLAIITVSGYKEEIILKKVEDSWKITGLFGVKKSLKK